MKYPIILKEKKRKQNNYTCQEKMEQLRKNDIIFIAKRAYKKRN